MHTKRVRWDRRYLLVTLIAILVAVTVGFGACAKPKAAPTPAPTIEPVQPLHEEVTFQLTRTPEMHQTIPSYSFPIYLKPGQELYLSFYTEEDSPLSAVGVDVTTPSGKPLGYKPGSHYFPEHTKEPLRDTGVGSLEMGSACRLNEGHFRHVASEQGFYIIKFNMGAYSSDSILEAHVLVEYWYRLSHWLPNYLFHPLQPI